MVIKLFKINVYDKSFQINFGTGDGMFLSHSTTSHQKSVLLTYISEYFKKVSYE